MAKPVGDRIGIKLGDSIVYDANDIRAMWYNHEEGQLNARMKSDFITKKTMTKEQYDPIYEKYLTTFKIILE